MHLNFSFKHNNKLNNNNNMRLSLLYLFTALALLALPTMSFAQGGSGKVNVESFDSAASVEGWTPVGDAAGKADETTFEWAETAGVSSSGALRIGGVNADGQGGRAYIFEKVFTDIDFGGNTNVTVSVAIKSESLVGTNVFVLTDIGGSVVQRSDGIVAELSDAEYTTFTFNHEAIGSDANAVKVQFNIAAGAAADQGGVILVDDISVELNSGGGSSNGDELLTNGDFETGDGTGWTVNFGGGTVPVQTEGGNSFFFANVESANPDQPFLVNLTQEVEMTQGENYVLSFDASTGAGTTRTMIAGIGLNEGDFRSNIETITLTDQTQNFSLNLTASSFGGAKSRVLFDMAGAVGVVVIDNVSLTVGEPVEVAAPETPAPTPPARNAEDVISLYSDAYSNMEVSSFATEWSQGATVQMVEIAAGDSALLYNIPTFFGIQLGNTIDLTEFTHMHFDYWIADNPLEAGAIMNPKLSNWADGPDSQGETSAIGLTNPVSVTGEWVSQDLVLADFVSESANGLLDREKIFQILFTTAGKPQNVYIDNLYFWKEPSASTAATVDFEVYMHLSNAFDPAADQVFIAGGFTDPEWQQPGTNADLQLAPDAEDELIRTISLDIEPGTYPYKFFLATTDNPDWDRGEWVGDPNRSMTIAGDTTIKVVFGIQPGQGMDIADANTLPEGAPVQVEGIITTPDFGFNNGQFHIQDASAGIAVFYRGVGGGNTETPFIPGHEIQIIGELDDFNNLLQINPSSYTILSEGNELPEPVNISPSDWTADSPLIGSRISLNNVTLVDPTEWPTEPISSGSGLNVEVTDGQNTYILRIDRGESFFDGSAAPDGAFNISGVMGVFREDPQLFPFFEDELSPASGTSVEDDMLPKEFSLEQNYPNPFNPTTTIQYSLPEAGTVTLEIYNLQGQRLATVVEGFQAAGNYTQQFDASNFASGIYLYRLQAGTFSQVRRMTLIK